MSVVEETVDSENLRGMQEVDEDEEKAVNSSSPLGGNCKGEEDEDEDEERVDGGVMSQLKKTTTPGIIYLSRVPDLMSVKKIRQIFSEFGEIDRIFLQPDEKRTPGHKPKKNRSFTEGWIEFTDKRVARRVAKSLNNQSIGGRRRSRWYDELWNMKYLKRFQWTHLNERLAYERAVHKQRMRTEVAQVKREMTHFVGGIEKHNILERLKKKRKKSAEQTDSGDTSKNELQTAMKHSNTLSCRSTQLRDHPDIAHTGFQQKRTDDEAINDRKQKLEKRWTAGGGTDKSASAASDKNFLRGIFSGGGLL